LAAISNPGDRVIMNVLAALSSRIELILQASTGMVLPGTRSVLARRCR
jgi:hypothetical protein